MRNGLRKGEKPRLQRHLPFNAGGYMPAVMHPMLNTAVKAARRAGTIINRASQNLDILAVTEKTANDYVSEVDRAAEQSIVRALLEAYPSHSVLAEESGASRHFRISVDHRSARRHHEFSARLPAIRGVDRARAQGRAVAGGHLRSRAQRSFYGDARPRRLSQRQAPAHQQAHAICRKA